MVVYVDVVRGTKGYVMIGVVRGVSRGAGGSKQFCDSLSRVSRQIEDRRVKETGS